jgi:glycosyltransferase involved in cell wall biosynthesis
MIAKTSGGLLVEPGNPERLAAGLYQLWKNPAERTRLEQSGFDGVRQHYSVARSADRMLEVYACCA